MGYSPPVGGIVSYSGSPLQDPMFSEDPFRQYYKLLSKYEKRGKEGISFVPVIDLFQLIKEFRGRSLNKRTVYDIVYYLTGQELDQDI